VNFTIQSIIGGTRIILDIAIMWFLIYYVLKIVKSNSRTIQLFKGILLILVVYGISNFLGLNTLAYFASMFINWGFLAIIIIFQPELRGLLERLGKSNSFNKTLTLSGNEIEKLIDELVKTSMTLSREQIGALISMEQSQSLQDYIKTGVKIDALVSTELLTSIFITTTPLHDGAVIIQGDKIACASSYFPPTNLNLPSRFGSRHRAAIGISEITDSITIVISEETGNISIAEAGKITVVDTKQLREYLLRVLTNEETEVEAVDKSIFVLDDANLVIEDESKSIAQKLTIKHQDKDAESHSIFSGVFSRYNKPKEEASNEEIIKKLEKEQKNMKVPHHKKNVKNIDKDDVAVTDVLDIKENTPKENDDEGSEE
jgi:uncharacterized protein (TIGR00159 family)